MNRIAEIQNKVFRKRKVIARRNYVYLYRSNDSIAAAVRSLIKFSSLFISIFLVVPRPTFFLPKKFLSHYYLHSVSWKHVSRYGNVTFHF